MKTIARTLTFIGVLSAPLTYATECINLDEVTPSHELTSSQTIMFQALRNQYGPQMFQLANSAQIELELANLRDSVAELISTKNQLMNVLSNRAETYVMARNEDGELVRQENPTFARQLRNNRIAELREEMAELEQEVPQTLEILNGLANTNISIQAPYTVEKLNALISNAVPALTQISTLRDLAHSMNIGVGNAVSFSNDHVMLTAGIEGGLDGIKYNFDTYNIEYCTRIPLASPRTILDKTILGYESCTTYDPNTFEVSNHQLNLLEGSTSTLLAAAYRLDYAGYVCIERTNSDEEIEKNLEGPKPVIKPRKIKPTASVTRE